MTDRNLKSALTDLIAQIEQEAYARGWDDCIQHFVSTASQVARPRTSELRPAMEQKPKAKASYGAVPILTDLALGDAGDRGVTPAEVVIFGKSHNEDLAESSVRRTLAKMVSEGTARKERGRYFLIQSRHGGLEQETGDAYTSPADNVSDDDDGGYHAAA